MKTKRVVKLSELHQIIGNYLYMYGDANIASIATHTNSDHNNHLKYSFCLTPLDRVLKLNEEEDVLTIDYHEIPIEEPAATFSQKTIIRPSKRFNGNVCVCCGKPVDSEDKVVMVCNKCASEFKFGDE